MQPNAPFYLRVESGPEPGQQFPIVGIRLTIGRQAGNAIVIDDERLSRRHAQIDLRPGGLFVTDLGSANGTRVNGQPITGAHPVRPGDALDLGGVLLRVEGGAGLAATAVAVAPPPAVPATPGYIAPPVVAAPGARSSSSRLFLIVGGVLAVLLVCGCVGMAGILVLANRGSNGSDSSGGSGGNSGGSGGSGASGGGSSSTKRQAGYVNGIVLDARGKGVANATIIIVGTTIAGERTEIDATTDGNGRYSRRVPDGLYSVAGRAVTRYNGKDYRLLLDPDDGAPNRTYDSKQGIIKDFHWKLTGLQPGGTEDEWTDYYGAVLRVSDFVGSEAIYLTNKESTLELTLTPRGPLIDGTTGQVIVRQIKAVDLYSAQYSYDVPVGAYTATARLVDPGGTQRPVQLAPGTNNQYASSLNIDFVPGTAFGVAIFGLYLK